ncbi:MAG: GtrA family protein [Solirubrobacteraceae bacterium]
MTAALRDPRAWLQLLRFSLVGASGYIVNLAVFDLVLRGGGDHRTAATAAFVVAVTNNFLWNRRWTFADARDAHAAFQAARFLAVSLAGFLFSLGVLELLVTDAGVPELTAQAVAIVSATPLSFLGNRLWSFRR